MGLFYFYFNEQACLFSFFILRFPNCELLLHFRNLQAQIVTRLVKGLLGTKNETEMKLTVVGREIPFRYAAAQLSSYYYVYEVSNIL